MTVSAPSDQQQVRPIWLGPAPQDGRQDWIDFPEQLFFDNRLGGYEMAVYSVILLHDLEHPGKMTSLAAISEKAVLGKRTVQRKLQTLVKSGYISMTAHQGKGLALSLLDLPDIPAEFLSVKSRDPEPELLEKKLRVPALSPTERIHTIYDIAHRDGWNCRYCPKVLTGRTATLDHLLPRARGGTNNHSNLGLACQSCNSKKSTRTEAEFLAMMLETHSAIAR